MGLSGGPDEPPSEFSMFVGLVKPLEDGDSGTPLRVPTADGDLESKSDALRRWGVALVYRFRVFIGDARCGRAGERDDAIPEEALLSGYGISICAQKAGAVLYEKIEDGASLTGSSNVA